MVASISIDLIWKKTTIRNKVRGITSNEELDRIFDEDAVRED